MPLTDLFQYSPSKCNIGRVVYRALTADLHKYGTKRQLEYFGIGSIANRYRISVCAVTMNIRHSHIECDTESG